VPSSYRDGNSIGTNFIGGANFASGMRPERIPAHRYFFRFVSNNLRIRLYSSTQLASSSKPWFSTG
jgi:hypothetical protein